MTLCLLEYLTFHLWARDTAATYKLPRRKMRDMETFLWIDMCN